MSNHLWEKGLDQELVYWEWVAKARIALGTKEMVGRDDPAKLFNEVVASLIRLPFGSTVRVLDVGSGPLSPLGLVSDRFKIEVVGIDPLAERFCEMLDRYQIGIGSSLRPRQGKAEQLDVLFPGSSFDAVVSFNSLDHTDDPILALNQMVGVARPGAPVYIWCYRNEGTYEKHAGLHQWDIDLVDGQVTLQGFGQKWHVGEHLQHGLIDQTWLDGTTVKPTIHFVVRKTL